MRSKKYFVEMLHVDSLKIANPFLVEEKEIICNLITQYSCSTFIGIGSGSGLYFESISPRCQYVGIDPCYQLEYPKIINKRFQDVLLKRGNEKLIISFLFNVIAYNHKNHVVDFINKNSKRGDIITISSWKINSTSYRLRKNYLNSIRKRTNEINFILSDRINNFKLIDLNKIHLYKNHDIIKSKYSTLLIIYL